MPGGRNNWGNEPRRPPILAAAAITVVALVVLVWVVGRAGGGDTDAAIPEPSTTTATTAPPTTTTTRPPYDGWVDPLSVGEPWGTKVQGLLTFRGNPTRTFYGSGPVPRTTPEVLWRYPAEGGLCSTSRTGGEASTWCGTGWTGQPAMWERNGLTLVAFGAYDRGVHILDAATGRQVLPPFVTGDIIKGTVTIDPDGYPLLYTGSRDSYYRVLAFDRLALTELWKLSANAVSPVLWNDDWDGSGLIIDDYLFEGGENSQIHIVKLNRGYDAEGQVTVDPQLVFNAPGWDDDLLSAVGQEVSIENSVAISGNTLYFANSGGLVQGWDISGLAEGREPERVFRFWTGDDTDATIVVDDEGMLYVGSEYERGTQRSREVGQFMKLDPSKPDDPLVWSIPDAGGNGPEGKSGVWSTAALAGDVVIATTNGGRVMGIDRRSGEILWTKELPPPVWQSPVVVDDVLLQGDCQGVLHAYDLANPRVDPPELWNVTLGGCIESTPAVWGGRIVVGTRNGGVYALGDPAALGASGSGTATVPGASSTTGSVTTSSTGGSGSASTSEPGATTTLTTAPRATSTAPAGDREGG